MTATVQSGSDQMNRSAEYDDGVKAGKRTSRWQKHGHDRLYVGDDGYIDLQTGEAHDVPNRIGEIENIRLEPNGDIVELVGTVSGVDGVLAEIPQELIV